MTVYSNSLLGTYEQCPLKYKLRYRDRIKREFETVESFLGTMVHWSLKKCYDDYGFGRDKDLDELLSYFNGLWKHRWNDSIRIMKQDKTQEDYKSHGEEMLANYYRHYSPFNSDLTINTEVSVSFFLDDAHKYRMIGYIDRLSRIPDGIVQIHDYKTSANLPSQADVDTDRQLALYQIGVQQKWPEFKNIRLIWHYLAFDMELVSSRSPEAISELSWNTMKLIDEIESPQAFPPRESGLCGWCEYPGLCPLRKNFVKVNYLTKNEYGNDPGVILVDKYTLLKNQAEST
ncbi:PD-(D/E)XK nuclease family protein, partial [bacterium]|nr:PD-(D/E)XK nuclease family protein [bacterium]